MPARVVGDGTGGSDTMPTLTFDTKDLVPKELGEFAKEITEGEGKGKWAVNVVPKIKLDEFRDNNTALAKKIEDADALISKVKTVAGGDEFDPEKFGVEVTDLRKIAQQVKDGTIKATADIDVELGKRTESMRAKHDQELQGKQQEVAKWKAKSEEHERLYRRTFIDRAVTQAVADEALGVEPMAAGDITSRAYGMFTVEPDGSLTPKKDGQTVWGEDGSTPMSVSEWINTVVRKEAPYFFKRSTGGGASGGSGAASETGGLTKQEFAKLSPLQRLQLANAETAKKNAKAA